MEELVQELITCKMQLAEAEDRCIEKTSSLKQANEQIHSLSEQVELLRIEQETSMQSIKQLIEERNALRVQLEEFSGLSIFSKTESVETEEEANRAPDQFLEIGLSEDYTSNWTKILENWQRSGFIGKAKLRFLAKKGIPSKLRGEVWSRWSGDNLCITPNLFSLLLSKARSSEELEKEENGSAIIPIDLRRTLGKLQVFQEEQPLHEALGNLLEAFAAFRPDVGYIQGMAYLGAILLLHMPTYRAFVCFSNMIFQSPLLRVFYSFDLPEIHAYYRVFEHLMAKKVPAVYQEFKRMGITPDAYLLEWVYTLFARCFPFEVVSRLWDIYFFEGDAFVFRVGLAIFIYLESKFRSENSGELLSRLTDLSAYFPTHKTLFKHIERVPLSANKLHSLKRKLS